MLWGMRRGNPAGRAAGPHTVLFAAFALGMGLVSAVAPLTAQAYGARTPRMVRRALRVGLWAAFMLGVPVTLVQFRGEVILIALGQAPDYMAEDAGTADIIAGGRLQLGKAASGGHRTRSNDNSARVGVCVPCTHDDNISQSPRH
jgi:hypothetical protein